jgi:hypothetical protein
MLTRQASKISQQIVVNDFAERRPCRAPHGATNQSADDDSSETTYGSASRASNDAGGCAYFRTSCHSHDPARCSGKCAENTAGFPCVVFGFDMLRSTLRALICHFIASHAVGEKED